MESLNVHSSHVCPEAVCSICKYLTSCQISIYIAYINIID